MERSAPNSGIGLTNGLARAQVSQPSSRTRSGVDPDSDSVVATRRQGRYWMATIPSPSYTPYLPPGVSWIKGQLESGDSGYLHWQLVVATPKKVSLAFMRRTFGSFHFELTRSEAAEDYVWKEATRVEGTQFELGKKAFKRNSVTDWELVWDCAKSGRIIDIEADVRIRYYR